MKKIFITSLLLGTLLIPPSATVRANIGSPEVTSSQRESMLRQIRELMVLIEKLQDQLRVKQADNQLIVPEVKERVWLPTTKQTAEGSLFVKQVAPTTVELSGILKPPTPCTGSEQYEFLLELGNEQSKTLTIKDCKQLSYKERALYTPSLVPAQPALTLRSVDVANNVWMNYLQARYTINLTNPLHLEIKKISSGEKG